MTRIATGGHHADGSAWFTEHGTGRVGRLAPDGVITEYAAGITGRPLVIATGPDGALWFTESPGNKIGRLDPGTGVTGNRIGQITSNGDIFELPPLASGAGPGGLAEGPDGNVWFAELTGNSIGRLEAQGIG